MITSTRTIFLVSLLSLLHTAYAHSSQQNSKSTKIQNTLKETVAQHRIPGVIAAIASSKGIVAIGTAGIRKAGSRETFTENDVVHIGSCTKAMTSVLIATLVKDKVLSWETTVIEVFPELRNRIHPEYHTITIWELLTHRSGVPSNARDWWSYGGMQIQKRRIAILKDTLKAAPKNTRGKHLYSNLGYMIAGCMAERLAGSTWESLMQERIFNPLGMSSAGFGPPGKRGGNDQPWGHNRKGEDWNPLQSDNAKSLGPAGTVHCTIEDWAKFIAIQLPDGNHLSLNQTQLKKLIAPTGSYAGGWIIGKRSWAEGIILTHSGSNTMWHATAWVAPNTDRAFMVVTNSCDNNSNAISDKLIAKLIEIDRGTDEILDDSDAKKMNGLETGKIKPSNAVSCWKLDRRTGAVIDTYGVNNGVNHNSKREQKGRINNAFGFDGEGDYVLIPDSDSLDLSNSLTISMWVNPNRHRNWQGLIGKWQTGQQSFAITPGSSGHIRWISSVSGRGVSNVIIGKTPIPLKTWSHIAVTKDGSSLKIYLNGRLDKDASIAAQLFVGKSSLFIGSESTFWPFDGSIDEVIIFNTALNADELTAIYRSGVAGNSFYKSQIELNKKFPLRTIR